MRRPAHSVVRQPQVTTINCAWSRFLPDANFFCILLRIRRFQAFGRGRRMASLLISRNHSKRIRPEKGRIMVQ